MSPVKYYFLCIIFSLFLTSNSCNGLPSSDGERSFSHDVKGIFSSVPEYETIPQSIELADEIKGEIQATKKENVCVTPACKEAASIVLENMDKSVAPCDDFFHFACGKFIKSHIITTEYYITVFTKASDKISSQLRSIIGAPIYDKEPRPFVLAKTLYKSCMDQRRIEEVGFTPMEPLFQSMGGWPAVKGDRWEGDSFEWWNSAIKFREAGYSSDFFVTLSVNPNPKNNSVRMIELSGAFFDFTREFLTKKPRGKIKNPYETYLVDVAVRFGANQTNAAKELRETSVFSHKLQRLSKAMSKEEKQHAYNPMSVAELQRKIPSVPWREYIEKLMAPQVNGITEDEIINVKDLNYLQAFEDILRNTPKRVQANYAACRAVMLFAGYLNYKLQTRFLDLDEAEFESRRKDPVWEDCVLVVEERMSLAVGSLYVTKHFQMDLKEPILEIVNGIREETYKLLTELDWMDEKTKYNLKLIKKYI